MENLAPPHELLLFVRSSLESGESTRKGIIEYVSSRQDEMAETVTAWLSHIDAGQPTHAIVKNIKSPYRKAVLSVLERGLKGGSIHPIIIGLEEEVKLVANREMEVYVSLLPLKMLVPLLLFQAPSLLMVILGPLLLKILEAA